MKNPREPPPIPKREANDLSGITHLNVLEHEGHSNQESPLGGLARDLNNLNRVNQLRHLNH